LQAVVVGGNFRLAIVLNHVEIFVGRIKRVDEARVDEMNGTGCLRRNRVVFGNVGEWNELLALRQRQFRPEWHACSRRQSTKRESRFQDFASPCFLLLRHALFPLALIRSY
jgi:hypothetical protein